MITDWAEIGRQIGSIREDGEAGGDDYATAAFETILGDEWITATVEYSISMKRGQEVAMNCLRLLRSEKAVLYAYQIYKSSTGERASQAVWFIKQMANPISISWIEEFLNDPNVIEWGLGVLDKLLWGEEMPYDEKAKSLLDLAVTNSNGILQEHVNFIKEYIAERDNSSFGREHSN
ncbi:hypothetical protein Q4E93_18600 [Flavitalea sp. BT771]|uniref:hypothetical protein n=1 Tax=Flavitalea sp. BT771 TaxID=3063329 RepID=UPI0026E31CDA|nr:hypothetical protein [Flavitalea sp. BT771]MDO6432622.1 hypothetical protein [Flavitalea sp. BT771]MDV6222102.1 hypothetical protein [Flavitalea sp. BT771]